jgi:hypothetical protein
MMGTFFADTTPSAELCGAVELANSSNPFATQAYIEAVKRTGRQGWVFGLRDGDSVRAGCFAYHSAGKLNQRVEITSAPNAPPDFWPHVLSYCREHGVSTVEICSFGSHSISLPPLDGESHRTKRQEFIRDLTTDLFSDVSTNHKRNIKKGMKADIVVGRNTDDRAVQAHIDLMAASLERRRDRGEDIHTTDNDPLIEAAVKTGAGVLFQVSGSTGVLSSVLVLTSSLAGYYHSAGTSPEGMQLGASHFLIHEICNILKAEGKTRFILGGAEEGSSLAQFKSGFGAQPVFLEAATCDISSGLRRTLNQFMTRMRA